MLSYNFDDREHSITRNQHDDDETMYSSINTVMKIPVLTTALAQPAAGKIFTQAMHLQP